MVVTSLGAPRRDAQIRRAWRLVVPPRSTAYVVLVVALILTSRSVGTFVHPQLYAEDGHDWYADSYNDSLGSLFRPLGGYMVLVQRLIAAVMTPLGLQAATALFPVVGVLLYAAAPAMFLSPRFRALVRSDRVRLLVAVAYVLTPCRELLGNVTNIQWHLASLALLIVLAPPPTRRMVAASDAAALALSGLSGPYALVLLPVALWSVLRHRAPRVRIIILGLAAVIQVAYITMSHGAARTAGTDRWTLDELAVLPFNQFLAPLTRHVLPPSEALLAIAMALPCIAVLALGWLRGPYPLRALIAVAVAVALAGIAFPYDHNATERVHYLLAIGSGERYFFLIRFAALVCAGRLLVDSSRRLSVSRVLGGLVAVVLTCGYAAAWRYPEMPRDSGGDRYAAQFAAAPPHSAVTIPISPRGWVMVLRKP